MEEEYSLPPDASVVRPTVSSSSSTTSPETESFYSEPLKASGSGVFKHHPASPFELVAQKSPNSGGPSVEVGFGTGANHAGNSEAKAPCPQLKPVHKVGTVAASSWTPVDPNLPLSEQPWFHPGPGMDRQTAEQLLRPHPEGAFLVRCCQTADSSADQQQRQYSLSLRGRHGQQCIHMRIERTQQGQYVLGQYSQPFTSVPLMIRHYGEHLLPIKGIDRIILGMPVVASGKSATKDAKSAGEPPGDNQASTTQL
ncbi:hypothetical protein BOX15_Mlig022640g1 [Macrostomum lignano]|uniref:Uncharacterized protein n=2 Tax=Macrostomum lignano TaxID=282301 RepID=A0A267GTU4_9PLAT|nr:hypothetical protein BOX15_Mlig022640g1 [Macrostomum lignano]